MFSGADIAMVPRYYLAVTMQYLTLTLFKKKKKEKENNQNQEYFLKCFRGLI